ncbi:MAG: hypothetical protein A2213_08880 [Lysobacterales bacterium RIFOXYA1_FULL_68_6]|jgi:hypothetical protein|nr:MAG: hypothetical protein A2213_08880 [Xanthomonadales bacterium RIFOXYA1_FULL_68_6]
MERVLILLSVCLLGAGLWSAEARADAHDGKVAADARIGVAILGAIARNAKGDDDRYDDGRYQDARHTLCVPSGMAGTF